MDRGPTFQLIASTANHSVLQVFFGRLKGWRTTQNRQPTLESKPRGMPEKRDIFDSVEFRLFEITS